SAKTFAYASGCALLAVETFAAIALQVPSKVNELDVIADAQQEKIYVQRFIRARTQEWTSISPLSIVSLGHWLAQSEKVSVTGPGLHVYGQRVSASRPVLSEADWDPRAESLFRLGLLRYMGGQRDDFWKLEPLYLRPSSAEETMASRKS